MSKPFILVLDHGTTGIRACLMNREGKIVAQGYEKVPQIYPQPGWVEQDPKVLWQHTLDVINEAFARGESSWHEVETIGLTNQRETVILWDKITGKPVYNAIVWQCRRTSEWCKAQQQDKPFVTEVREKTGLVLDAYFSASKVRWLLDHCPETKTLIQEERLLFGTVDTWILWNLTGGKVHATDYTNASRTMLYNIQTKAWDDALLERFGIPRSILPEVKRSSGRFGSTIPALSDALEVPITGIIGDQQAALYGQKCWTPGSCKNTFGTGAFLVLNLGDSFLLSEKGLLTTLACNSQGDPIYALEGSIFIAGAAMEWLKDTLGVIQSFAEADSLASELESNDGVYLVPAFVGLGAPYWRGDVRGIIGGLTQGTGKAHFARAGFEAIAYQTDDLVTLMKNASHLSLEILKVDGGVSRSSFLVQFLADLLDVTVEQMLDTELTAKGAGYLAGLASGFWSCPEELLILKEDSQQFFPKLSEERRNEYRQGWQRAVKKALLT